MPRRKAYIEQLSDFVIEQYCPQKGAVDLMHIVDKLGIKTHKSDFHNDFEGLIVCSSGRFTMFFNQSPTRPFVIGRQRFSLAHELGHYHIPDHRKELMSGTIMTSNPESGIPTDPYIEKEANHFAACLLMPSAWFAEDVAGKQFSISLLTQLADFYEVSLLSAINRFATLASDPILILQSHNGKIATQPFDKCHNDFPHHKILTENKHYLPANSLSAEISKANTPAGPSSRHLKVSDWFKLSDDSQHQNTPLIETCYRHESTNQIITILHFPSGS